MDPAKKLPAPRRQPDETPVLPHEDKEAYFHLWTNVALQLRPRNSFEYSLVDSIVTHQWTARRLNLAAQHVSEPGPAVDKLRRRARFHAREATRMARLFNDLGRPPRANSEMLRQAEAAAFDPRLTSLHSATRQ